MGYDLKSVFRCFLVGERNEKEEERASGRGAGERGTGEGERPGYFWHGDLILMIGGAPGKDPFRPVNQ